MLHVQTILFPTDFSDCAEHAFSHAALLAAATDAGLHALYARVPGDDINRPDDPDRLHWPDAEGPAIRHVEREGDAVADVILDYAQEIEADLIVMGTHGRKGLQHAMLGSVAEKVVQRAACPVMTVPQRAASRSVERILAPVDFSEHARGAVAHARALAALFGAHLDVLHIVQETTVPTVYGLEPVVVVSPEVVERSQEALQQFVAAVPGPEVPTTAHAEIGYAAADIVRYADETGADLIVMATHGLTGLKHFLLGSVTEKVIRRASCPVLAVRSFGKALVPLPTAEPTRSE